MKKYKMDLHIHTPASKCYLGQKTDDEYFEILNVASDQGIEILAITDHNTVAGYERLVQLKEDVLKKLEFLEQYQNESYRMKEEYDDMVQKKKLFDNLLILPGVEITLNPGIHILVIGNYNDVDKLSDILDDTGYSKEKRGSDNDNAIDVDIVNFLKNPRLNGLIVSAPHIDSKNGIYNEMGGHYRSSVMKSSVITSFSINSDNQKENIIRMFSSDPEYKREKLPAFINCSDAHESTKVGSKYSYVELESKSFSGLVALFENPAGRITDTDDDRLIIKIQRILDRYDALLIAKPEEKTGNIAKILCAVLNEDIPVLVFGVDDKLKLLGVGNAENIFESKLAEAFEMLSSSSCDIRYSIQPYKLGNGKYIFILFMMQKERNLWYLKREKEVYYLVDSKAELASIEDIERIVYDNALKELLQMEQKDEERLNRANIQINSTKSRTDKILALKQIVEGSFPILHYCELDICEGSQLTEEEVEKIPMNGSVTGNSYYIFKNPLRLPEAILRFTCPTSILPEEILEKVTLYDVRKNSIVIVRGGGTHYISEDGKIFGVNEDFIVLSPKAEVDVNMKALLAWMKSSLFIWYIGRKFGSTDLYLPSILTNTVFPEKKLMETDELIEVVDRIITCEYEFLDKEEDLIVDGASGELDEENPRDLFDLVENHNNTIAVEVGNIDEYFFDMLGIGDGGARWISDDLKAEGIYDSLQEDIIVENEDKVLEG